jgi:hypothetical protein
MQIIISPVTGGSENFLLEVEPTASVASVVDAVAAKSGAPASKVKLTLDGLELLPEGGTTLADFYVGNLSTLRMVVVGVSSPRAAGGTSGGAGAHAPSPAGTAAGDSAPQAEVVSQAEISRTVIVTGIPVADPATTEKAIYDTFSGYGALARVAFQDESAPASPAHRAAAGSHAPVQHAVLVFHEERAATAALAASGSLVLGAPVRVLLANNLAVVPGTAPGARLPGGQLSFAGVPVPQRAAEVVTELVSTGYLYGVQGIAHLRRFDEERGLSRRVRVVTESAVASAAGAAAHYRVVETVQSTYEAAKVQAEQLDARYRIREHMNTAAAFAMAKAGELGAKAMEHQGIHAAVTAGKSWVEGAGKLIDNVYHQARTDVHAAEERIARATPPAAATGLPPAQGAGAAAAPVAPVAAAAAAAPTAGQQ